MDLPPPLVWQKTTLFLGFFLQATFPESIVPQLAQYFATNHEISFSSMKRRILRLWLYLWPRSGRPPQWMETPQLAGNESWTHSNSLIFSSLIVSLFSSDGALRGNELSIFSSSECRELRQASVLAFPVNSKRQTMEEKNGFLTTFVSIF